MCSGNTSHMGQLDLDHQSCAAVISRASCRLQIILRTITKFDIRNTLPGRINDGLDYRYLRPMRHLYIKVPVLLRLPFLLPPVITTAFFTTHPRIHCATSQLISPTQINQSLARQASSPSNSAQPHSVGAVPPTRSLSPDGVRPGQSINCSCSPLVSASAIWLSAEVDLGWSGRQCQWCCRAFMLLGWS